MLLVCTAIVCTAHFNGIIHMERASASEKQEEEEVNEKMKRKMMKKKKKKSSCFSHSHCVYPYSFYNRKQGTRQSSLRCVRLFVRSFVRLSFVVRSFLRSFVRRLFVRITPALISSSSSFPAFLLRA